MRSFLPYFHFELKSFFCLRNIVIILAIFFMFFVMVHNSISDYEHLSEKNKDFESYRKLVLSKIRIKNYDVLGEHGVLFLLNPSVSSVFYNNSLIPQELISMINSKTSVNIYHNMKGRALSPYNIFIKLNNSLITVFFLTLFAMGYGFESAQNKKFLKMVSIGTTYRKNFLYITISRMVILFFLVLLIFGCLLIYAFLRGITFRSADWMGMAGLFTAKLIMLYFFYFMGILVSHHKSKIRSLTWGLLLWFIFVFIIPTMLSMLVDSKLPSSESTFRTGLNKFLVLRQFEKNSEKSHGSFDRNKIEAARALVKGYMENDFVKIQSLEKKLLSRLERISNVYQNYSIAFPTTLFLNTSNEVSSMGYQTFFDFYDHLIKVRKKFMEFWIDRVFYKNPKIIVLFKPKNGNIFWAESKLPQLFLLGIGVNIFYVLIMAFWAFHRFAQSIIPKPAGDEHYKDFSISLESGKRTSIYCDYPEVSPQLYTALHHGGTNSSIKIEFTGIKTDHVMSVFYLPSPEELPGDIKAEHLIDLHGKLTGIPLDALSAAKKNLGKKITNQSLKKLDTNDRARVMLEIALLKEHSVYFLDDFYIGIKEKRGRDISDIGDRLMKLKSGRSCVLDLRSTDFCYGVRVPTDKHYNVFLKDGGFHCLSDNRIPTEN